jgi:predicted nucleotidyltransferase
METLERILKVLAEHKDELRVRYGVQSLAVFGSFARGEPTEESDIDLLVEFERPIGLFKFLELEEYLSHLLGRKVDLVSRKALKPHIGRRILEEVVPV